jgi:hypothetical protein
MTETQKKAVTWTSLVIVGLFSVAVIYVALLAKTGRLIGDQPMGELFLELSANFSALGVILKALCAIVLAGIGILGASHRSTVSISAMTILLIFGIIASIALLITIGKAEIAANLWGPSRIEGVQSFEELQSAARPMVIWMGGALSVALAAFLGISVAKGVSNA